MGKKLSQSSLKISKKEKKQFNSLIKVLRPKVYITDSSSFKRLVQELTGNGTTISSPPPTTPQMIENVSIIDIEDHGEHDSSIEASFDASIDSFETCNQEYCYTEELQQELYSQMYLDDTTSDISLMNQPVDLFTHQDLESWLLDIEPYPFSCGYSEIQQEVSIYDYELSGLII